MASAEQPPRLQLTEKEHDLQRLLLDVAKYVQQADGKTKASELRFAGGWVRDKLLGVDSHDIDVAIDDTTGYQYGLRMKEYLEIAGNAQKYGLEGIDSDASQDSHEATSKKLKSGTNASGSVPNGTSSSPEHTEESTKDSTRVVLGLHKIEANPEKSKHLETVATKVFGLDVDLVNLRKEVYNEETRLPEMQFADTPEEDALRRDATINALFYNLQTEEIEDLTRKGLKDMQDKIVRTPLEPFQTFRDDPLRVLRLIRFASRFDYTIDDAAKQAMKDQSIKDALRKKISRERIGVEFEKMLRGPDPHMALALMDEAGLYDDVFSVQPPGPNDKLTPAVQFALSITDFNPEVSCWRPAFDAVKSLMSSSGPLATILIVDHEDTVLAWLLSCFVPLADAPEPQKPSKGGKAPAPLASTVAREGIKAPNKLSDVVFSAVHNSEDILSVKDAFTTSRHPRGRTMVGPDAENRDTLGRAIRRWGPTWRAQTVFAYLLDLKSRRPAEGPGSEHDVTSEWNEFITHLQSLDLLQAYDLKPIIDGKVLSKELDTKPGPWMTEALDIVIGWQLRNPGSADRDAAIQAVRDWRSSKNVEAAKSNGTSGELRAALIHHFLSLTVRPLFSKTKANHSSSITAQGRARQQMKGIVPRKDLVLEDEEVTRPWKAPIQAAALDLLRWCVRSLTVETTEIEWPLLVPPILTLLDDTDTKYKALGAELLHLLLEATSPALLSRTGIAGLFRESLEPSLHQLPSLTAESDSVVLLQAAYAALIKLLEVQYATPGALQQSTDSSARDDETGSPEEKKALAHILHSNLLPSFTHLGSGSTYPTLTSALLAHTQTIIISLGIDTVAQIIHLVPLCRSIIASDPFATSTTETLGCMLAGVELLAHVIANAWVRMHVWRGEVLSILAEGWLRTHGDATAVEDDKVREVNEALRRAVRLLIHAIEGVNGLVGSEVEDVEKGADAVQVVNLKTEMRTLVEADDRLEGLFP